MKNLKKKKKIKNEDAPANNVGSGNIAMPEPVLFDKGTGKKMKQQHDSDLRKFSSFVK